MWDFRTNWEHHEKFHHTMYHGHGASAGEENKSRAEQIIDGS